MVQTETFTMAKASDPNLNEDLFLAGDGIWVMADGSTPKAGNAKEVDGRSGGVIAADIVTQAVLNSEANGRELVDDVTKQMRDFYAKHCPEALNDPKSSFATTFVAARVVGDRLVITQVGDTGFRVNGGGYVTEQREQDVIDAAARAVEIKRLVSEGMTEKEAAALGRNAILDSLNGQWKLWNNDQHPQGFGYVNGHNVPDKFVRVYEFMLDEVDTLELVTDGYPKVADKPTIESWEAAYEDVQRDDPYRYLQYPATKPADDRCVAVIRFTAT